jgi:hypothetical protein
VIFENPESLQQRIRETTGWPADEKPKVIEDTTEFMSIDRGHVLRLAGNDYLVLGNAREGRFGIDDQPKFWVKTALDLTSGERKIIKLKFEETFTGRIGSEVFHCIRSGEKESAVVEAMHGHPCFMQGVSVADTVGNLVRILDFVPGQSLYEFLRRIDLPHRDYYQNLFPGIMPSVIECIEAIAQLHQKGLQHGDIRADHIIIHKQSNAYVWIDFDYVITHPHYDLFSLGNILLQAAGKGRHSIHDIRQQLQKYPDFKDTLTSDDMSLIFAHRVANLRKLFPYLSADLNEILMRFSAGRTDPYRDLGILISDLRSLFPKN